MGHVRADEEDVMDETASTIGIALLGIAVIGALSGSWLVGGIFGWLSAFSFWMAWEIHRAPTD